MKSVIVCMQDIPCGILSEDNGKYAFTYNTDYEGIPISLRLPLRPEPYTWEHFPPFFDGLLPEGIQLDALLRIRKIDKRDYMSQLQAVGGDMVGAVTILPFKRSSDGENT